jgi:hypothetical protein
MSRCLFVDANSAPLSAYADALRSAGYTVIAGCDAQSGSNVVVVVEAGAPRNLLTSLRRLLVTTPTQDSGGEPTCEPHAINRWTRAVVPIIDSPRDPRTIDAWGRWVAASPGTLRNWCRTAGLPARRSLVFGRLLRSVYLANAGQCDLENTLDVADLRTLSNVLTFAGFNTVDELPLDVDAYLERQRLIRDPAALNAVSQAIDRRRNTPATLPGSLP